MPLPFILASVITPLLTGIAINIISYLLTPKAKEEKPEAVKDLEAPTADAGRPIPVVFGEMLVRDPNCIAYMQNRSNTFHVKAS